MKIGTVPKITAGAVVIVVFAFIGTHQFMSSKEDSTPSVEVVTSTESANSNTQRDSVHKGVVTAPSREDKPQISAEEMEQIEKFFAKLEGADAQSGVDKSQLSSESGTESMATDANGANDGTSVSADAVMNAYVERLRNLDFEAIYPLVTGDAKVWVNNWLYCLNHRISEEAREFWRQEILNGLESDEMIPKVEKEMAIQEFLKDFRRKMQPQEQNKKNRANLERRFGQVEFVSNKFVRDEFHFRLRSSGPFYPEELPDHLKRRYPKYIDVLVKMQNVDGAWQIYKVIEDDVFHH